MGSPSFVSLEFCRSNSFESFRQFEVHCFTTYICVARVTSESESCLEMHFFRDRFLSPFSQCEVLTHNGVEVERIQSLTTNADLKPTLSPLSFQVVRRQFEFLLKR